MLRKIKIGLLGCGNVGTAFVKLVKRTKKDIIKRFGFEIEIERILIKHINKPRPVDKRLLTLKPDEVLNNKRVTIVTELIGGEQPPKGFLLRALTLGKHVVTANKTLIALAGPELFRRAARKGVSVNFEASVCSGVPVIRALQNGLSANRIESICGILNGTTNYVLTRLSENKGCTLEAALEKARDKGLCESDASFDLDGLDAAWKLAILASIAFDRRIKPEDINIERFNYVHHYDSIRKYREDGFALKQVASAHRVRGHIELSVKTCLLPTNHPLGSINNEDNGLIIKGDAVGEVFFRGKGAGPLPTASAVLSDIIDIAQKITK